MHASSTRPLTLLLALASAFAHAAHPLISEDTGTQGAGKFELEVGAQWGRESGGSAAEIDPQLSFGARDELDLIVRPSLFRFTGTAVDTAGGRGGLGPVALDVKWRAATFDAWSFGARAGIDTPSVTHTLVPRTPGWHALVMATWQDGPTMFTSNVAYQRLPAHDATGAPVRRDVMRFSAALVHAPVDEVRMLVDVAVRQSADPVDARWPAVAVLGVIVRGPAGIDLDAGYQARLNAAAPAGLWQAGATFRW
jgi:hypothetical protein